MKIKAYIEVWKGNKRILVKPVKSFVRQFIDIMRVQMAQSSASIKDTSGAMQSYGFNNQAFRVNAGAGDAAWGIQVGTGTNAVAIGDYTLQSQISHGTGSGQLQYGAVSVGTVAVIPPSAEFTIARTFTNLSGADITVNEVGLVHAYGTPTAYYFLLERSLLSFVIPNGESRTVTYKIKVTV
jgi:hypothetical protein